MSSWSFCRLWHYWPYHSSTSTQILVWFHWHCLILQFSLTFRLVPLLLISMASNLLPLNFYTVFLKVLFLVLYSSYSIYNSTQFNNQYLNHLLIMNSMLMTLNFFSHFQLIPFQKIYYSCKILKPTFLHGWPQTLECSTTPSLLSFSFFSISLSSLTIFFSIPQATKNSPFSSFLSSLAYLISTGLTPWNFDSACLSSIIHSISLIIDPFICSTRFNFMFVI